MKTVKVLAIVVVGYLGIVVAFECLVVTMGKRQADSGVAPDENWLVITTTDAEGSSDAVVAGVESDGQLYVSANHWPRGWYHRAVENPDVEITRAGRKAAFRAVPVTGAERVRIAQDYKLPWVVRFLSGFPPRSFLRLNDR
jgi:F420H(2)-dependent quinone reductase